MTKGGFLKLKRKERLSQTNSDYEPASVQDTIARLKNDARFRHRTEPVSIRTAFGRVLARDIVAKDDIPRYDVTHMDGYAVSSEDIADASEISPVMLKVKGRLLLPGNGIKKRIGRGEAYAVATGSRLPDGADTVVPVENVVMITSAATMNTRTEKNGNHGTKQGRIDQRLATLASRGEEAQEKGVSQPRIKIQNPLHRGAFVYHAGADAKKGELLLQKGTALRSQDVGMLASLKMSRVPVFTIPKIAIIPTGDELTDDITGTTKVSHSSSSPPKKKGKKVLNSNSPVLTKLIEGMGAITHYDGIAPDDFKAIRTRIKRAIRICDMVITLGGSSAGKFDLVETAIDSLGKPGVIARGIAVDRGRVTGAGIIKRKPIVILPGPIQGAVSGFIALALPLIEYMTGSSTATNTRLLQIPATLATDWRARNKFRDYLKVVYVSLVQTDDDDDGIRSFKAEPVQAESESMKVLVKANGYVIVPESVTCMAAGSNVSVQLLPGFSF
ncbi:MAG TPA: molybdopterin molybdotransferase MoeA [Nitrososphaera sp.]|nr:molybdopterin molybdotransferase MoeA [Nitrososphaera sp.]